jgi:Spy/CpxP family protein refolding chaperone
MKTSRKIALGTVAALGMAAGGAALAHDHGWKAGYGHEGHGSKEQCRDGKHEARLDALKSDLKLSPAQEPAWQTFESAVKAQKEKMRAGHDAPEDTDPMQARIEHMEQRLAGMKEIQKARNELYQVLSDEQKAVLDKFGPRGRHG